MGAFAVLVFVCSCMVCTIHSTESAARVYRSGSTSAQGCARSSLARARANLAKRPAGRQGPTNRRNRDLRAIPADLKIPTPTCHVLFCELELRTSIVRPRIQQTFTIQSEILFTSTENFLVIPTIRASIQEVQVRDSDFRFLDFYSKHLTFPHVKILLAQRRLSISLQ